mmetsp:Transcript_19657/g.21873  ORF Transcript_19657/g.21873 Transcript_19657/m.21873 type:complete len:579 (-) Transcript_19657:86-1822(-)
MNHLGWFVTLAVFVVVSCAQENNTTCHAYVPALRGTPHRCDEVITNNTLVHYYGTLTTQEEALKVVDGELFNGLIDNTGKECRASAVAFACLASFQICDNSIPLGYRIPCKSLCENVTVHCGPVLQKIGFSLDLLPNCNNETIAIEECSATEVNISDVECKAPLLFDPLADSSKGEPVCWKCPPPVFTQRTLDLAWIFKIVGGGLSMIFMGFSVVVFAANPKYRRFQTHLFIIISADSFLLGLGLFMVGVAPSKILCESPARDAKPWHVLCTIQGSIFVFFGVQIITAWLILSLNLVWITVRGVRFARGKFPLPYRITMYILLWGLPTLQWVIALAFQSIKPFIGFTSCFVTNDDSFQWGVFFGWPLIPITIVGITSFSYVLYRLSMGPKTAKGHKSHKDEARKLVLGFMAVYIVLALYILIWRIQQDVANNSAKKKVESMLQCLLQVGGENCIEDIINVPALMILYMCAIANGIPIFVLWVSSRAYRIAVLQLFGMKDMNLTKRSSKASMKSGSINTLTSRSRVGHDDALSIRSGEAIWTPRENGSDSDVVNEEEEKAAEAKELKTERDVEEQAEES